MTPRMIHTVSARRSALEDGKSSSAAAIANFATIVRAPMRLGISSHRLTSRDLQIVEATDELLNADLPVPAPESIAASVSFLKGFNATVPSAEKGRVRRRKTRNVDTPRLGLKKLGRNARGLLGEDADSESVLSEDDVVLVNGRRRRKGRQSLAAGKVFGREELARQTGEIEMDKENLSVRRVCETFLFLRKACKYVLIVRQTLINSEIEEITTKIDALDALREKLQVDLLLLQEEELELNDERTLKLCTGFIKLLMKGAILQWKGSRNA